MLVRLFGIVFFGSVLGGCAVPPLEQVPPYKVVTVDMPVREAYDNLNKFPYCGVNWELVSDYDTYTKTFAVKIKQNWINTPYADLISGKAVGDSRTELRLASIEKWETPISQQFLNRLQTGKCE